MKQIAILLTSFIALCITSCKKNTLPSNTVEEVVINTTRISNPTPGVIVYTVVPYENNLAISATLQRLKGVEWVDITIEDPSQTGSNKAVFRDRWSRQRITYTNGIVSTSFPGGLGFLPPGRGYVFHILFSNTSSTNLLQIDACISRGCIKQKNYEKKQTKKV